MNPSALPPVDAVVFDMDGLLLDTEVLAMHSLQRAGEALGIDLPLEFCHRMIGVPVDGCRRLVLDRYGDPLLPDRLLTAADRQLEAQVDAGLLRRKPGVDAVLGWLDRSGLPRAVATSSSRAKATRQLRAAGLTERFDAIVTRDDVARGKPYPDLFLAAAQRLGVAPGRCLALEDSHNGVRAAHAAGMPVVMVPDLLPATDEMRALCVAVLPRLDDLLPMLGPVPVS